MHCILWPVLAGKNPTYMSFTDSIHELDHFVKSRAANGSVNVGVMATAAAAVHVPRGNVATTATAAAAAARVSLSPATVLLGAADSDNESKEIDAANTAVTAANTAYTAVAVNKRKKIVDALSSSAAASKKSRTAKEGKKDPPVNLFQFPMYVVTNDCKKHHIDAITHGRKWVAGDAKTINGSIAKEPLSNQRWHQRCPLDEKVFPGNREFQDMTPLEAFLMMMPPDELDLILELTNKNFESSGKKELSLQELLRWFGVIILMSASNFRGDRRTLWEGGGSVSKYLPPVDLKATGMSPNRWEDIWYAIRWSRQPSEKPPEMSSERYRWLLVDDFITNFNAHRASTFYPGVELEADKSMVPWYGYKPSLMFPLAS